MFRQENSNDLPTEAAFQISSYLPLQDFKTDALNEEESVTIFKPENFNNLPFDLILLISSYFSLKDFKTLALIGHAFNDLTNHQDLWKNKLLKFSPALFETLSKQINADYKITYRNEVIERNLGINLINHPHLFTSIISREILNWHAIRSMSDYGRIAVESLLDFIARTKSSSKASFSFFARRISPEENMQLQAANTLKEIIFDYKNVNGLDEYFKILSNDNDDSKSRLISIYNELINAGLIADRERSRYRYSF